jgi:hypothetical protein
LWEFLHVRMLFSGSTIASAGCAYLSFAGRDYDYQTLNLTFTVNVVKFGLITGRHVPKSLRQCVVSYIRVLLSLKPF